MARKSRVLAGLLFLAGAALGAGDGAGDLGSPDPDARREAALRLAEAPEPGAFEELIRAVRRESDGEARRLMLIALGRLGDPRALGDLWRRIDDPDRAALWAIRTILESAPPGPPDEAAKLDMPGPEWDDWRYRKDWGPYVRPPPAPDEEPDLLARLRSPDERVALRAAERLDPSRLTLAEIRIQASLLSRDPCSFAFEARGNPLGTVDFPVAWTRLASSGVAPEECRDHWPMLPDAIPVLASLLPEANAAWFREFTRLLLWVAESTDRYRAEAARGFFFALRRFGSEGAGSGRPPPDDTPPDGPGEGLPTAFVALARHRVRMAGAPEPDGRDLAARIPPLPWLRRWARDLVPAPRDLPFLEAIARGARDAEDRAWAVRAAGRLAGPAAAAFLAETAAGADEAALFAAAELAKDGMPGRFRELLAAWRGDETAEALAFEAIPEEAVRRWIARIVEPPPEDPWDDPLLDPGAEADMERFAAFGFGVGDEVRETLAAALPVERLTVATLAWFLTRVSAAPLRGPAREKILDRLREYEIGDDCFDTTPLSDLLGLLEVRAPDRLVALLHHWVAHREGELRGLALRSLGALGDTRFVPELLDSWSAGVEDPYGGATDWLGRVKDPRVAEFLAARVRAEDPAEAAPAMVSLAVYRGLPEGLASVFGSVSPGGTLDAARKLLLDGDAVGAALLLFDPRGPVGCVELGTVGDPRAVERLAKLRSDRRTEREATVGLALAGDATARAELEGLLRDGRTWLFYPLRDERAFTFGGDPAWVGFWVDRVDATCCLGFAALEILGRLFPLLCTREVGFRAEVKDLIDRWWRGNRDALAFSRILDGWVSTR